MNLDSYSRLTSEQQQALDAAFKNLEGKYWDLARNETQIAINCNVGQEPCEGYTKYDMTLVEPSEADHEKLRNAVNSVILPTWSEGCDANYPECAEKWNSTIGAARGLKID
jgi:TRAP-type C4-dicarboxylate transport system substrate-binding protein